MEDPWSRLGALPPDTQKAVKQFSTELQSVLGSKLVGLIVYGGVAKGEFFPGRSDINILLIAEELSVQTLDKIRPITDAGRREFNLDLILLERHDLTDAGEVFSAKFLDIKRHHILLIGGDILQHLELSPERLRRQCVRELINRQLRLRKFYLEKGHYSEALENILRSAISPYLATLSVALELRLNNPVQSQTVALQLAAQAGLNTKVLQEMLALKAGQLQPAVEELKRIYQEFIAVLQQSEALLQV